MFIVYGDPRGKGRPRAYKKGNFIKMYTDDKTMSYEAKVAHEFIASNEPKYFNNEPLIVTIGIYQQIPKNTSKKQKLLMLEDKKKPIKKPDIDNVIKAVLDGLNKVAYGDDTQVIGIFCNKFFDETPKVTINISKWE